MNGTKLQLLIPPLNDCDSILHIDLAVTVYIATYEYWAGARIKMIIPDSFNLSMPATATTGAITWDTTLNLLGTKVLGLAADGLIVVLLLTNPDPTINDPPIILSNHRSACPAVYITLRRVSFLNSNLFTPFFPYLTYLASFLSPQA